MKRLMLVFALCMLLLISCQKETPQSIQKEEDEGKVLTFALFSDLHNNKSFYDIIMKDIEILTEGRELDGLALVGDITYHEREDIPSAKSYELINSSALYTKMKEEGKLIFAMGNHEMPIGNDAMKELSKQVFAEETGRSPESDTVIGGYHFITAGPDSYAGALSAEQEKYVFDTVKSALADGSEKPVFLLIHHPIDNTLYGTEKSDYISDGLEAFLKGEPRLVVISGHTHYPSSDPKSILQIEGGATFLYTSSLMGGNGLSAPYATERHTRYPSQGIMMEINDKTNVVTLKPFYAEDTEPAYIENAEWTLDIPAMIKNESGAYKYTEKRAETSAKPVFAEGAELTVGTVTDNVAIITFPSALQGAEGQDSIVAYYKIDLCDSATGELILTKKIISDFFIKNKRESYKYYLMDLSPSTDYTVSVTPISAWYAEGETVLTSDFTTEAAKFEEVPLDSDNKIVRNIFDASVKGSHTPYTNTIQIGSGSSCVIKYIVDIEKAGDYRVFMTAASSDGVDVEMTVSYADEFEEKTNKDGSVETVISKDTEIFEDTVTLLSGSIGKYQEITCADISADKPGKYLIKIKKKSAPCTVGMKDLILIKHG